MLRVFFSIILLFKVDKCIYQLTTEKISICFTNYLVYFSSRVQSLKYSRKSIQSTSTTETCIWPSQASDDTRLQPNGSKAREPVAKSRPQPDEPKCTKAVGCKSVGRRTSDPWTMGTSSKYTWTMESLKLGSTFSICYVFKILINLFIAKGFFNDTQLNLLYT